MAIFTVEKLASLCRVDRETIRRWRNRGVNGVKLQAINEEQQRGVSLMFNEEAVRTFIKANPRYMTPELDEILNGSITESRSAAAASAPKAAVQSSGYVRQILELQREELLQKLREVERALEQLK